MSPQRIQLRRSKGWRMPEGAVYVGRPSKWGNPFEVKKHPDGGWMVQGHGTTIWGYEQDGVYLPMSKADCREIAVAEYERIHPGVSSIWGREVVIHLRGHDLACWCPVGSPCHADYLIELANPAARGET